MTYLDAGKAIRLGHLFDARSGRTVIVPIDHGIGGAVPGIADLERDLPALIAGEPDALIVSAGVVRRMAAHFHGRGRPGVIIAVDTVGGSTLPGRPSRGETHRLLVHAEQALRLGADALKVLLVFGRESAAVHADNVEHVAALARECEAWGLPLLVEPVLWGQTVTDEDRANPDLLRHLARIGVELGADFLKIPYPGAPDTFRPIVETCPVPIVILGGPKMGTVQDVLDTAAGAVAAGAAGVAFGRNVFQQPDPAAVIRGLREVVHGP